MVITIIVEEPDAAPKPAAAEEWSVSLYMISAANLK